MPTDQELLEQRIAEEKAKIRVDTYQDVAYEGSFRGGGRGLWSGSLLGGVTGAIIGAVAPFIPIAVGLLVPSVAAVVTAAGGLAAVTAALPASIAIFAAMGISMGFAAGAMTGRAAGSVGAVAKEQEARIKGWTIEQILKANPDAKIEHEKDPVKEKTPKSLGERVATGWRKYFNLRTGAFFTVAGIIGGLVIGAAFVASGGAAAFAMAPALGAITGLGAATFTTSAAISAAAPAIIAYSAGVAGMFGLLGFGTNYPKIGTELQTLTGNFLSGKYLGREFGEDPKKRTTKLAVPDRTVAQALLPQTNDELLADQIIASAQQKPHVTMRRFDSFREMVISGKNAAVEAGEALIKR
jgi:hypothetical protein